ncbi:unnamed protein product [Cylicocyclus nassatus]|uniref:BRCT domain-containing protein n=1 Tax=Cylicocyclus nassatus TaxID=53992 RepID=A0AA36DXA0_CYLNA|nr:unnamed protein product [Cylicocyclus nassatus]
MADAATGVSENLTDSELTNGSSDSNTSGSGLLSRKGLFGKSGVLNLEANISSEKDALKPETDKTNGDGNDEANTSGSGAEMLGIDLSSQEKEEREETAAKLVENDAEMEQGESGLQLDAEPADVDMAEPEAKVEHINTTEVTIVEIREEFQDESDPVEPADQQLGGKVDEITEAEGADMNDQSTGTATEGGESAISSATPGKVNDIDNKTLGEEPENSADKEAGAGDNVTGHQESPAANKGSTDKDVKHSGPSPSPGNAKQAKDKQPESVTKDGESVKEPEPIEEEICVKKIISMDTDDTEQDGTAKAQSAEETIESSVHMEITEVTTEEAYTELAAQKSPLVEEPEAAESEGTEESEKDDGKKSKNESYAIEEMEVVHERVEESVTVEKKDEDEEKKDAEEDEEKEAEEVEETPKRRTSARRSAVASSEKKTPARAKATPAKKATSKKHVDEEKADDEEKPEEMEESEAKTDEAEEKEEEVIGTKSLRSRTRRSNVAETPKADEQTPKRRGKAAKSAKKDVAAEAEDESEQDAAKEKDKAEDKDEQPSRPSLRSRASKTPSKPEPPTPKSTGRKSRAAKKEEESVAKKEDEAESRTEPETPRRGKKAAPPSAAKTPKSAKAASAKKAKAEGEHDPYDIDTEMERHPEPLKNIQMEVQSFESRVGNLAELAPRTKQRKSLADLTPGRKKASPTASGSRTAPHSSRGRKSKAESDEAEKEEEAMETDETNENQATGKKVKKGAETPKTGGSGRKRRASPQASVVTKRPHIEVPQLSGEDLVAVDLPQDEHAACEAGARVYAMFDGIFYPAIVVSRDGLGRYKVSFVEDGVVKDVPLAGVIPLRALDQDKECYYADSSQKDRLAVKVVKAPDGKHAAAWEKAEFELEQLDDEGNSLGKKLKGVWTNLALSKEDWRDYINKKSREASDVITDNIESTEDRHLRRSRTAPSQEATPGVSKATPKTQKKAAAAPATPKTKTPARGGRGRKKTASTSSATKEEAEEDASESAPETSDEQIFAGKLFILTSANRPNIDTGFKKKFMTDFISSHGGLVVDDMKEVDEHPEMERFLISDTHYRTHKYLAALVRAMPCVSHEWIYKCLDEKKLVDYKSYLLPSGVSILDDREYPLPKQRGVLLRNKRVMVHSNVVPPSKKSMSFEQIWVPMVPQLGGEVVSEMPDEEGKLDILLTDHSATPSLVEKARKIGAAVVSSEWLIQGIIMDRLPDVNAHQKFLHNGGVCT